MSYNQGFGASVANGYNKVVYQLRRTVRPTCAAEQENEIIFFRRRVSAACFCTIIKVAQDAAVHSITSIVFFPRFKQVCLTITDLAQVSLAVIIK